jgi:Amt family ammonium transporter
VWGTTLERIKFGVYIIYAVVFSAIIYPIGAHWIFGGGWLATEFHMQDFAGSTVVHLIGATGAFAALLLLGARRGKYGADGKPRAIPGHNMPLFGLGVLILWLGWFGFNPGSTMAVDPDAISRIAVTTALSSAASTLIATLYAWWRHGKPDFSMTVNGCLAGLVSITAPCAFVTPGASIVIGAVAGVTVSLAVPLFDRMRLDDPVGATSVHLVHGILGTIWVGLFGVKGYAGLANDGLFRGGGFAQLGVQLAAVVTVGGFSFVTSLAAWYAIKRVMGLRVTAAHEVAGLDLAEMGMEAYPEDALGDADADLAPAPRVVAPVEEAG